MNILAVMEQIFRERQSFFSELKKPAKLLEIVRDTAIIWAVAFLVSGAVIGIPGGVYQMLASAIKLPLVFGLAAVVMLPVLYFLFQYINARLSFLQVASLLSAMLTVIAMLTLAFAPVLLVLWLSVADYGLYKLATAAVLGLSGVLGVLFLKQGLDKVPRGTLDAPREGFFWMTAVIFALVGGQLAWVMRPFVGQPGGAFLFFRGVGGSLYAEVAHTLWSLVLSLI